MIEEKEELDEFQISMNSNIHEITCHILSKKIHTFLNERKRNKKKRFIGSINDHSFMYSNTQTSR